MKDIAQERMDPERKQTMRHMLQVYARTYTPRPSVWSLVARHGVAYAALTALLLAGGATALAGRATPGGILYPVKLAVNDRVSLAMTTDEDVRLEKELKQMERILNEEEYSAEREFEDFDEEQEDLEDDLEKELKDLEKAYDDSDDSPIDDMGEDDAEELEEELREMIRDMDEAAREALPED